MGSKIGYPTKILNLTQLDLDYQEVRTLTLINNAKISSDVYRALPVSSAPHRHRSHPVQRDAHEEARGVA